MVLEFALENEVFREIRPSRTRRDDRRKVPVKLGSFLSCSIAAFFSQAARAGLEPIGRSDRWIDCPVDPTGWGRPEMSVAGLLVPWIVTIAVLGFLLAWLVTAILERTGLARHVWHLPLCFLALVILFSSLIGAVFLP
jgi:hypothetical protein